MAGHDIIVVGASAGGVEALVEVVRRLPPKLPAAIFVVLHIPAQSPSLLPEILARSGLLVARHPEDNEKIERGHIYVALPDRHLLVERGYVRVTHGPKENRHRPAVDPLFRSAALAYGPRVVGVVLSGALDDGTAGLLAVKRRGGIAVVQDPNDALYPGMPQSALQHVEVDYSVPLSDIGHLLKRLVHEQAEEEGAYALKTLEESASLSRRLMKKAHQNGQEWLARNFEEKLQEAEHHSAAIKNLLMKGETTLTADAIADQAADVNEGGVESSKETA